MYLSFNHHHSFPLFLYFLMDCSAHPLVLLQCILQRSSMTFLRHIRPLLNIFQQHPFLFRVNSKDPTAAYVSYFPHLFDFLFSFPHLLSASIAVSLLFQEHSYLFPPQHISRTCSFSLQNPFPGYQYISVLFLFKVFSYMSCYMQDLDRNKTTMYIY